MASVAYTMPLSRLTSRYCVVGDSEGTRNLRVPANLSSVSHPLRGAHIDDEKRIAASNSLNIIIV